MDRSPSRPGMNSLVAASLFILLFCLGLPRWAGTPYVLGLAISAFILAIEVLSWNLYAGPSGEISFGHSAFIGIGAYGAAISWKHLHLGPVESLLIGVLAAGITGWGVALLVSRLTRAYFAIATLAFQMLVYQSLFLFPDLLGGEEGIVGGPGVPSSPSGFLWTCGVLLGLTLIMCGWFEVSRAGRIFRFAMNGRDLAEASGIATSRIRTQVFAVSAALAGLGGVLQAGYQQQANATLAGSDLSAVIVLLGLAGGPGMMRAAGLAMGYVLAQHFLMMRFGQYEALAFKLALLMLIVLQGRTVWAASGRRKPPAKPRRGSGLRWRWSS